MEAIHEPDNSNNLFKLGQNLSDNAISLIRTGFERYLD